MLVFQFLGQELYGSVACDFYGDDSSALIHADGGGSPRANHEATNYYLQQLDTLGEGKASKFVWRVNPAATIDASTKLCAENSENCINPYAENISDIKLKMSAVYNFINYLGDNLKVTSKNHVFYS